MDDARQAFTTCPKGLESLLLEELRGLGASSLKETVAGVGFEADIRTLYRVCLWSRLANRVHLRLANFEFTSEGELYEGARQIEWDQHMGVDTTFSIYLPRYIPTADVDRDDEDARPKNLTGKGKILLVEDEEAVRMFAARALHNKGYTVLEADCG